MDIVKKAKKALANLALSSEDDQDPVQPVPDSKDIGKVLNSSSSSPTSNSNASENVSMTTKEKDNSTKSKSHGRQLNAVNGTSNGEKSSKELDELRLKTKQIASRYNSTSDNSSDLGKLSAGSKVGARDGEARTIGVFRLTERTNAAWEILQKDIKVTTVSPLSYDSVRPNNCLRFVCISDTHSKVEKRTFSGSVPDGDVLLHAGDFTYHGVVGECVAFNQFLGELPHPIKLLTPGNHDVLLDPLLPGISQYQLRKELKLSLNPAHFKDNAEERAVRDLMSNAAILIDTQVEICGIKIYGCPWVPSYGYPGFGMRRGRQLLEKYNKIPSNIDILLSHGPPLGFGDLTSAKNTVGCCELLNSVRHRIKPKYVVSGHIHEGHGVMTDGTTTYINACICTKSYRPSQKPIIFDYPLPEPFTREDFLKLSQADFAVLNKVVTEP